jgi:Rrf2 family protein
MKITRRSEYAIKALAYLVGRGKDQRVLVAEISEAAGIPQSFLAKIFQDLARAGLIRSHRGAGGGFSLAKDASDITVKDIVEKAEGTIHIHDCLGDSRFCEHNETCALRDVWKEAQDRFLAVLDGMTLEELAAPISGRSNGKG